MNLPVTPALFTPSWHAELELGYARVDNTTRPVLRRHLGPLRVQKHLYAEGPEVCQHIIVHPPGGIAGGDRLDISAHVGTGAWAQLTSPGAAKWYRASGPAFQHVKLTVEAGATLEWLPQETIVFDGARARMETRVRLAADSRFIGWDILCLGRAAAGERFEHGRFDLLCRIERDGVPLWLERGGFDGADPMLASPAGWAGHGVGGTLLCAFPDLPRQAAGLLEALRAITPGDGARHGITALPGVLVARYLGDNSEAARLWFACLWQTLRPACCGRPAVPPRIWNT